MNDNKKTKTTTAKTIMAAATILAVVASAAMVLGTQMSQYVLAQTYGTTAASASAGSASNPVMVDPSKTTSKEFWINTVHLDGATSLHAAVANPLSAQNTPLHPAEVPPANSTIPTGGQLAVCCCAARLSQSQDT